MRLVKKSVPPGTNVYTGNQLEETSIKILNYHKSKVVNKVSLGKESVVWYQIDGLKDQNTITEILNHHNIDALIVEDVFNVNQRTKITVENDLIYVVINTVEFINNVSKNEYYQFILKDNVVFTFSETTQQSFASIEERINSSTGIIREKKADYLIYVILDTIIDNMIETEALISTNLSELESLALTDDLESIKDIHFHRKNINILRNTITALMEPKSFRSLLDNSMILNENHKYFDDVLDHIYRLNTMINDEREIIRNIFDIYSSNISNKMNAIMKTLTIFSAIFIPLSFIAGVFGMNFIDMDILKIENGFTLFLLLCVVIIFGMFVYFKKRKWL
jgi:magnesium transporter